MACSLHVLDRGSRAVLVTPSPTDHSQIKVGLYSSPACISPPPPPPPSPPLLRAAQLEKRHRSSTSTYDRAVSLGIADRLLEIPPSLHGLIESGGPEKENAKRALHKLHQANQQLIARAENSRRLKEQRTKIPTARRSRSNRS